MDWCSVYLTPQGLPKYIYLSPPLIFPTTYNGIRTKNRLVWITPGAAPIRWLGMGPIRNPRWEQKRTEGYVIVSTTPFAYDYNNCNLNLIMCSMHQFTFLKNKFPFVCSSFSHGLARVGVEVIGSQMWYVQIVFSD